MAKLVRFKGEGRVMMSGVSEYVVLVDDDLDDDKIQDFCAPGFERKETLCLLINMEDGTLEAEWPSWVPTEETLVRE